MYQGSFSFQSLRWCHDCFSRTGETNNTINPPQEITYSSRYRVIKEVSVPGHSKWNQHERTDGRILLSVGDTLDLKN